MSTDPDTFDIDEPTTLEVQEPFTRAGRPANPGAEQLPRKWNWFVRMFSEWRRRTEDRLAALEAERDGGTTDGGEDA